MKKFCHHCGKQTIIGAKFCGECGTSLSSLSSTPTPVAEPAARPPLASRQRPVATFTPMAIGYDDDEESVDRLESLSHLNITSLDVDIVKDRPVGEKLGEAMAHPMNPAELPANRPAVYKSNDECREDFKREAGALISKNRVASVEVKG